MVVILLLILIFLLVLFFIFSVTDFGFFDSFIQISIFIIIILYILAIFKIIINHFKYKNDKPLKKIKLYSYIEVLANELNKINTYQKIIVLDNKLIIINFAGVFEIVYIDSKGQLKGDINGPWYLNNEKIINPFSLKEENVFSYLISNGKIKYELKGIRLVPRNKIYIVIEQHLNKKIYTEKDIDNKYNEIKNNMIK